MCDFPLASTARAWISPHTASVFSLGVPMPARSRLSASAAAIPSSQPSVAALTLASRAFHAPRRSFAPPPAASRTALHERTSRETRLLTRPRCLRSVFRASSTASSALRWLNPFFAWGGRFSGGNAPRSSSSLLSRSTAAPSASSHSRSAASSSATRPFRAGASDGASAFAPSRLTPATVGISTATPCRAHTRLHSETGTSTQPRPEPNA